MHFNNQRQSIMRRKLLVLSILLGTQQLSSCKSISPNEALLSSSENAEVSKYKKIQFRSEKGSIKTLHLVEVSLMKSVSIEVRSEEDYEENSIISPSTFSKENNLHVSLNANFYEKNNTPIGLVYSKGQKWNTSEKALYDPATVLICTYENTCEIKKENELNGNESIYNLVTGYPLLVSKGSPLDFKNMDLHPRSAIGIDKTGTKLYFVSTDGRAVDVLGGGKKVDGFSFAELAKALANEGIYNALNLDGGGSSNLIYKGRRLNMRRAVNPIEHPDQIFHERKVPVTIGVKLN